MVFEPRIMQFLAISQLTTYDTPTMKVLRLKRPASEATKEPLTVSQRKALECARDMLLASLKGDEVAVLLGGKSLVAWPNGDSFSYGLADKERGSKASKVELLTCSEDEAEANDYPIYGYRKSGKSITIATDAIEDITFEELGSKSKRDVSGEARASNGRWTSGMTSSSGKPTGPKDKDEAIRKFADTISGVSETLSTLSDYVDDHFEKGPDSVHWGHVGDAARLVDDLSDLSSFLAIKPPKSLDDKINDKVASVAFDNRIEQARDLIDGITNHIVEDHHGVAPDKVNWGHVADMAHVRDSLDDIASYTIEKSAGKR